MFLFEVGTKPHFAAASNPTPNRRVMAQFFPFKTMWLFMMFFACWRQCNNAWCHGNWLCVKTVLLLPFDSVHCEDASYIFSLPDLGFAYDNDGVLFWLLLDNNCSLPSLEVAPLILICPLFPFLFLQSPWHMRIVCCPSIFFYVISMPIVG